MSELLRDNHPALNKWLYQLVESIIEGEPVSKQILELILGLTCFERGAVLFADNENEFKLELRLGSFKYIKAVIILCGRSLDVRPNEIESVADLRKCRWVRNYQEQRGSEILSYAYIPLLNEYTLTGFVYLDSTVIAKPDFDSEWNQLRRFSKLMMQALAHDGITSPEPVEIRQFLFSHSLKEIQRVRLTTILDRSERKRPLAARKLGISLRTFFSQLSRYGIQRKNKRPHEVQAKYFTKTAS